MLRNFIKIAWRNVIRHKSHTAINVTGLALGMTCCLFIFLWVQDERSMDNFHADRENLYTVYQNTASAGKVYNSYTTPMRYVNNKPDFSFDNMLGAIPEIRERIYYATAYELP